MDTPRTATAAVAALYETGNVPMAKPSGWHAGDPVSRPPEDSALEAITRRVPPGPLDGKMAQARQAYREQAARETGVILALPPVLTTSPGPGLGDWLAADWTAGVRAENGWTDYPYPVGLPIAETRYRDGQRARRVVLAGPDAPPTPQGSWTLTASALLARESASLLKQWGARLKAKEAKRVQREAEVYRAYADSAEALIPESFAWLEDLPEARPIPAFATVPAVVRGTAHLGAIT